MLRREISGAFNHNPQMCCLAATLNILQLQDLRYNVARMLKDMGQMERSRWVVDPNGEWD